MMRRFAVIALLALTFSACQGVVREDPQLVVMPDRTDALLADAADRATRALETLAALERAKNPDAAPAPIPDAPTELRRTVTISWTGPLEPVAKLLADRASYTFQTIGTPPPTDIQVNLNTKGEQVITALRSIGLQLNNRATLKVDPNKRVIEIDYAPVDTPMPSMSKSTDIEEAPL